MNKWTEKDEEQLKELLARKEDSKSVKNVMINELTKIIENINSGIMPESFELCNDIQHWGGTLVELTIVYRD